MKIDIRESTIFNFSEFINSSSEFFNPNVNFVAEYSLRIIELTGEVIFIDRKANGQVSTVQINKKHFTDVLKGVSYRIETKKNSHIEFEFLQKNKFNQI